MTTKQAIKLVRPRLGEKRWEHTLNVRDAAVKLAKRYGADQEKAAVAAILHDSCKELSKGEMLQILEDNATMSENAVRRPSPVWHGICAAVVAQTQWGVEDEEILSAIRCHTTGKPGMSLLDKIIYLADMISKERDYPGVDDLRKESKKNLDSAVLLGLKRTVDFVREGNRPVDPMSVAAYEYLAAEMSK